MTYDLEIKSDLRGSIKEPADQIRERLERISGMRPTGPFRYQWVPPGLSEAIQFVMAGTNADGNAVEMEAGFMSPAVSVIGMAYPTIVPDTAQAALITAGGLACAFGWRVWNRDAGCFVRPAYGSYAYLPGTVDIADSYRRLSDALHAAGASRVTRTGPAKADHGRLQGYWGHWFLTARICDEAFVAEETARAAAEWNYASLWDRVGRAHTFIEFWGQPDPWDLHFNHHYFVCHEIECRFPGCAIVDSGGELVQ